MNKFNINIDLQEVVDEFKLGKQQVDIIMDSVRSGIVMEIHRNWVAEANSQLNTTRQNYINGLQLFRESENTSGIKLVGGFNNMIENGVDAFDMKDGFGRSIKARFTKSGSWYMHIPFRWGTPSAAGSSIITNIMPSHIYNIMKSKSNGGVLKESEVDVKFTQKLKRPSVESKILNKTFDEYVHKTSLYSGIVRSMKTFPSGHQSSTYNSFRTVSQHSDPNSWIHRGIKQYNLAQTAIDSTEVDVLVDNIVDKNLSELGF